MTFASTKQAWRDDRLKIVALAGLVLLALVSIGAGVLNAVRVSTDFQWSPAHLLSQGLNPYAVALSGDVDGRIFLSQYPPYLHLLYVLMLPLAWIPYEPAKLIWALINIALGFVSLALIRRIFRLPTFSFLALAALFFMSTPFRNGLGNGQTSMLCLTALLIWWLWKDRREYAAGASLSLLFVKYSFAPPFGLWLMLQGKIKALLASAACLIIGWLLFAGIARESPLVLIDQPMRVAEKYSESMGGGDVMTLIKSFGWDRALVGPVRLSGFVGIAVSCLWTFGLHRRAARIGEPATLAALCLIALISLRHLAYDYVFLAPVAAFAVSSAGYQRIATFVGLAYFAFVLKLFDGLHVSGRWVEAFGFLALNAMLLIVLRSRREGAG